MTTLLPATMLRGRVLGISVSQSPDLGRLGMLESHVTVVLGEMARAILASGGTLACGGHLDPGGYPALLLSELGRYARGTSGPLLRVYLAWSEHQRLTRDELTERLNIGNGAEVLCLDPAGRVIREPLAGRGPEAVPESEMNETLKRGSLTAMRRVMAKETDGRVLLGGKRTGFSGNLPGLVEEALFTLEAGTPLYLVAGLGGITVDLVRALGIDDCSWLPPDPGSVPDDPRLVEGKRLLAAKRADPQWCGLLNGLSEDENRRLAAAYRPGEIAALVALGLGRIAA